MIRDGETIGIVGDEEILRALTGVDRALVAA
jgi:hypothetical protein